MLGQVRKKRGNFPKGVHPLHGRRRGSSRRSTPFVVLDVRVEPGLHTVVADRLLAESSRRSDRGGRSPVGRGVRYGRNPTIGTKPGPPSVGRIVFRPVDELL